ncbi:MAG: glycoside hydrolase family 99-like domain-containing protein [Clostridia bacterium]|nr:glycoside hydrolase family 99-like domain-containing protein [Clostridia bacterium]
MKKLLKKIFWKLPINKDLKNSIAQKRYERILKKEKEYDDMNQIRITTNSKELSEYAQYIAESYGKKSEDYKEYKENSKIENNDIDLIAYYLTQFHPNQKNDEWWGKGTTEWNNVNQAIPQFVGHYQPRKPGELGYYDLRLKEVFERQIELAKNYGIKAFCYYYYWFDGERLLESPLNMFLKNNDLDIEFFYCWANENWTRRFSGTNEDILMKVSPEKENYKAFINNILEDFKDNRYYKIDGKPVLSIYRPSLIPEVKEVLSYWRKKVEEKLNTELYIIAVQEREIMTNWTEFGFDAETEFQPKQIQHNCKEITREITTIRKDFSGTIFDYKDLVENQRYIIEKNENRKVYPAVMPMWDNTARRNFRGLIFHNSSPELYKKWLIDTINFVRKNKKIEKNIVFINAWNEWGEGAYLEPDYYYGYAYLDATYNALKNTNEKSKRRN